MKQFDQLSVEIQQRAIAIAKYSTIYMIIERGPTYSDESLSSVVKAISEAFIAHKENFDRKIAVQSVINDEKSFEAITNYAKDLVSKTKYAETPEELQENLIKGIPCVSLIKLYEVTWESIGKMAQGSSTIDYVPPKNKALK